MKLFVRLPKSATFFVLPRIICEYYVFELVSVSEGVCQSASFGCKFSDSRSRINEGFEVVDGTLYSRCGRRL